MTKLDDCLALITEQKKQFIELARQSLDAAYADIFQRFPQVEALKFVGYTPYFNDGDECVYSVGSVEAKINRTTPVDMTCKGYSCQFTITTETFCPNCGTKQPTVAERLDIWDGQYSLKNEHPALSEAIKDLSSALSKLDEEVKQIYGDHAETVITFVDGAVVTTTGDFSDHE